MNKIYVIPIPVNHTSYGVIQDAEPTGDILGMAIKDDGTFFITHYSSGINWFLHDIGITSDWHHDEYKKACSDGYELVMVDFHAYAYHKEFVKTLHSNEEALSIFNRFL